MNTFLPILLLPKPRPMKVWFLRHKHESSGPYTIEELKTFSIAEDDYLWRKGLADWVQARSIPELNSLFTSPPPFQPRNTSRGGVPSRNKQTVYSSTPAAGGRNSMRKRLMWISIVLVLSLVTYLVYANKQSTFLSPFSSEKSAEQQKAELAKSEQQDPAKYISSRVGHRENLLGQTVVEGTLTSSATAAVFKDVMLQVDFISKTNAVIRSEKYTIYPVLNPGQTISFKEKAFAGKDVYDVPVTLLGASPADQ
jgi:hypothetical protein